MQQCSRCQRYHSPHLPCSIPGITLGFSARGTSQAATTPSWKQLRYQKARVVRPVLLETLLKQAKDWKAQVDSLLKALPPDSTGTEELLDREAKLSALIFQLVNQIAGLRQ